MKQSFHTVTVPTKGRGVVREANEMVQWTISSDERRSGALLCAPRGRDAASYGERLAMRW